VLHIRGQIGGILRRLVVKTEVVRGRLRVNWVKVSCGNTISTSNVAQIVLERRRGDSVHLSYLAIEPWQDRCNQLGQLSEVVELTLIGSLLCISAW